MIYTVTFNPAVDYVVHTDKMNVGTVNRSHGEQIYFGGKGINVSIVLSELGVKSRALGFVAGFTGMAIEQGVSGCGVDTDFIHLDSGFSRINVKIKSAEETELNGAGPNIPDDKLEELFAALDALSNGDTLLLAGSVPACLPGDIYEKILKRLDGKGVRAVVDAAGKLLLNTLPFKPFLVKPNNFELGELFGVTLNSTQEVVDYAKRLKKMGAANVLVSMAERGAVLVDENERVHICPAYKGTVKNSVGAGDSMVAGFLAGCGEGYDYALRLGTAAGGATAFSDGLAKREQIYALLDS